MLFKYNNLFTLSMEINNNLEKNDSKLFLKIIGKIRFKRSVNDQSKKTYDKFDIHGATTKQPTDTDKLPFPQINKLINIIALISCKVQNLSVSCK